MTKPFDREWCSHSPDALLTAPLRWRKPSRVRLPGDLFGDLASDEQIDRVFAVMALAPQHTFQVLTKRAERMRDYWARSVERFDHIAAALHTLQKIDAPDFYGKETPLRNVWLGVSAERQQETDERIPNLLATPAAVRFVSLEPLLGPIDLIGTLARYQDSPQKRDCAVPLGRPLLDWVIAGGESGKNARPMHPDWARSLRDQCEAAGVPFFFKQHGEFRQWEPGASGEVLHVSARDGRWGTNPGFVNGESKPRSDTAALARVGKKAAGRLLDGKTHDAFPMVKS